jgi:hypothetical protein
MTYVAASPFAQGRKHSMPSKGLSSENLVFTLATIASMSIKDKQT